MIRLLTFAAIALAVFSCTYTNKSDQPEPEVRSGRNHYQESDSAFRQTINYRMVMHARSDADPRH